MSFAEVLEQLPALTFEQRQQLIRRAVELDDSGLTPTQQALVESRLDRHRSDPKSPIPLGQMKQRLRGQ